MRSPRIFGGNRAVDGVSFTHRGGHDHRAHRAERGRQDDPLQLPRRPLSADRRGPSSSMASGSTGSPPDRVFAKGLARTFQIPRPFPEMTVLENVMVAPLGQRGERFWANWLTPGRVARGGAGARRGARGTGSTSSACRTCGPAGARPLGRAAQAPGARARARGAAAPDPARRARRRRQPGAARRDRRQDRGAQPAGHHVPDHRAQHGPGDEPVQPHHGDGAGPAADDRNARTRCARSRAWSRPTSAEPARDRRLRVEALEAGYEPGLPIVRGASLAVEPNEILAVLGPNGAGKSTLVKAIAGLVPVAGGRVVLHGREITGRAAHRLVARGARLRAADRERVRQPLDRGQSRSRRRHPESAEKAAAGRSLCAVPGPRPPAPAARGAAFGRPAPDAGRGAGAGRARRRSSCWTSLRPACRRSSSASSSRSCVEVREQRRHHRCWSSRT